MAISLWELNLNLVSPLFLASSITSSNNNLEYPLFLNYSSLYDTLLSLKSIANLKLQ